MSEEHARQFIQIVEQDSALQQKIDAFAPATAAVETVKLGTERDLHFSAEEFNNALAFHLKSPDYEITEQELDSVAGGFTREASNLGRGTHYAPSNPNFNASGIPHPTYWVKHGSFSSSEPIDI